MPQHIPGICRFHATIDSVLFVLFSRQTVVDGFAASLYTCNDTTIGEFEVPVVSRYCNICNRLITAREIESGDAIVYQTYYYCPKCKEEAMPIIEAIRRRRGELEEKEAEEKQKKASTRFGPAAKHKPASSAHKLRKTRSGVFLGPKTHHGPKKSAQPHPRSHRPSSEFKEAIDKASGSHAPAKPSAPSKPTAHRHGPDSERIEVIDEPGADIGVEQGMSFDEVVDAAKPVKTEPGVEDKLAASGITFDDVDPASSDVIEEAPPDEAGPVGADEAVDSGEVPVAQLAEEAVEPEIVGISDQDSSPSPAPAEAVELKPVEQASPQQTARPSSPHARKTVGRYKKHVHPGKRHSALSPPKKKTPWLFIVVILLMALGGGGLIVVRQFFMKPEESPSVKKQREEEKKQYKDLEEKLDKLMARARNITDKPEDLKPLSKEYAYFDRTALSPELRKKLANVKKTATDRFQAAVDLAAARVRAEYEQALDQKDLEAAVEALGKLPEVFGNTPFATEEIPKLKAPVENTLAVLKKFADTRDRIAELERERRFDEAVKLVTGISYKPEEVMTEYLLDIGKEIARLRDLAAKERERIEKEEAIVRAAFNKAKQEARKLADEEDFQGAIDRLSAFIREYPMSKFGGETAALIEDIKKERSRAKLRIFFNGTDLSDWTSSGQWNVENSEITGVSTGEKAWLLKGEQSWTDYTFEFDFNLQKGSIMLCARAAEGQPESGFTVRFAEKPFLLEKWYHVKCQLSGSRVLVTTSLNNQTMEFRADRPSGIVGFLLAPESRARIKNVSMQVP